jgi:lysophospholipase L1-like esterase
VTPEFDYTADINRFGFRGPKNLSNLGGDSYDVLMIGDSFTFGWGLTDEETWPRRVEQRLRDAEPKVRIFNLGRPGYGPGGYVEVARRAVPILDPDLVVVNILQGDDLFQLAPGRAGGALRDPSEGARSSPGLRPREYFRRSLRNLHGLMRRLQGYSRKFLPNLLVLFSGGGIYGNQALELDIASDWVKQGEAILQTLSSEQRGRFEMLDDTVKVMFTKGWLNPYLVRDGVSDPGRFFFYEDLKAPATQIAIRNLAAKLQEIKDTAKKYSCDLLVSLVPYTPYVSSTCQPAWKGMGYALDGRLLFSNSSEAAIQEAAQMAGLDFYSPLAEFREAAKERQLYYEYDGHFNPAGAELYAQFMAELLETRVLRSPSAEKAVRGH